MKSDTADLPTLYNGSRYRSVLARIEKLDARSTPQWGTMSSAQMLAHCAEVQEVINGTKQLDRPPLIARLLKGIIRRGVFGPKPYRAGTRTAPQYEQTTPREFAAEKERLLAALETFVTMEEARAARIEHPLFGRTSREERGWGMYKHLDHHLRQFGV